MLATQPDAAEAAQVAREHVRYGASPRALQALVRTARVQALFSGRAHASFEDLHSVARPVFAHRILLGTTSQLDGVNVDDVIDAVLDEWREGID